MLIAGAHVMTMLQYVKTQLLLKLCASSGPTGYPQNAVCTETRRHDTWARPGLHVCPAWLLAAWVEKHRLTQTKMVGYLYLFFKYKYLPTFILHYALFFGLFFNCFCVLCVVPRSARRNPPCSSTLYRTCTSRRSGADSKNSCLRRVPGRAQELEFRIQG